MSGSAAVPARLVETHVSVVVMVGDRAYKVKKPVSPGFLDFSTPEAREHACRREVELNRRLAPDVYLGVATISDEPGRPPEHMVVMRRMPDDRRLARLVVEGEDVREGLRDLAHLLAAFHSRAATSAEIAAAGGREALRANWEANLAQMRQFVGEVLDPPAAARVAELALSYLDGRGALFERREREGRVRDGHGDLLAEDIFLLPDGPRVLDCIEFDDRLRYGDVLLDAGFLAMDLERLGRPDLGREFLDRYHEFSGENWPASLEHHFVAYRAHVRSKIACLRHGQGATEAAAEARRLHDLCLRHLEAGRVRLVLVGGLPGTGKSTVAAALAAHRGLVLLRSDEVRKDMAGIGHLSVGGFELDQGLYEPGRVAETYAELLARARLALAHGESVVLDASWSGAEQRAAAAEVARATSSELVRLRCEAPAALAADRMRRRLGRDASDALPGVAEAMAARFAPWPEAATIDTAGPARASLAQALRAGGWR